MPNISDGCINVHLTYIDARLIPEKGNGTSDLDIRGYIVTEEHRLLGLGKVGYITIIINATNLKPESAKCFFKNTNLFSS